MRTTAPARPSLPGRRAGTAFAGTTQLLRLYLRRDRIVLPLWVLLLSVPLAGVYIGSVAAIYPTAADRAGLAATIMASPAQRALYGQVYNDSLGAVGIWKAGMFHALIAIAVILTVIRHTRADEESGRTELVDSTAVGRYAGLTAALLLAAGGSIATGVIGAAGLLTTDVDPGGSLAFGAALACSGLVFTAVAAGTAQLSPSARVARTAAFGVLAVAFTLRAVGDAGDGGLSWLSPLGWALQVRPYAGDRWWVLLLPLAAAAALTVVAYRLRARRDVGAGLFAERPGPARASSRLRGVFGLAWRLGRGSLAVWTVGLAAYGLMIGSAVRGIGGQLGGDARDVVTRLGGTTALADAFIAVAFTMVGLAAAAFAVSLVLRLHQEEEAGHAEEVLAAAVPRGCWLSSHLVMALGASALALLVAGAAAGTAYAAATGDPADAVATIGAAAVQLPAVWLPAALGVALFGVAPRFTPAIWGALVAFVAIYLLGALSGAPHWVNDAEPFGHVPRVTGGDFTAVPLLWLLGIDAALIAVGAIGFARRDLRH